MPTIDIIVRRRSDGYQAFLADTSNIWERGRTAAEAIGKLVYSAQSSLGVTVIEEEVPRPKRAKISKKGKRR